MSEDELTHWHDRAEKAEAQLEKALRAEIDNAYLVLALQERAEKAEALFNDAKQQAEQVEAENQAIQEALEQAQISGRLFKALQDRAEKAERERNAAVRTLELISLAARNHLSPTQKADRTKPVIPEGAQGGTLPIMPGVDWVDEDHPCERCGQIMPHTHDLRPTQETSPHGHTDENGDGYACTENHALSPTQETDS